jgi:esterase
MVFLHGILGSGSNWRTFARRLVAERPTWRAVLVDLRKHGASQDFQPPHTLAACANDLVLLERSIGRFDAVIGHSFGGKVALEYLRSRKDLETVWVLDSSPGARPDRRGSESTVQIVQMLETLPERFATREAFIDYVQKRGTERSIAMWLAMNVRPAEGGEGYVMRVDVRAMRELLDDYFLRDEWPTIEDESRTAKVHLVVGGRSSVLDHAERARANRVAGAIPDRTWVHLIADAGHWVHIDAPDELFDLVARYTV